jgi:hypothetical protein
MDRSHRVWLDMPDDEARRLRGGRMRLERSEFHPGGMTRRDLVGALADAAATGGGGAAATRR